MKNQILLTLCCLATGCATVHEIPDLSPMPKDASIQRREIFYAAHKIEDVSGFEITVHGSRYDGQASAAYVDSYGDKEALGDLSKSGNRNGLILGPLLFGAGGAFLGMLGGLGGADSQWAQTMGTSAAIGVGVGAIFGILFIDLPKYLNGIDAKNSFNKNLLRSLNLDILPAFSGTEASASLRF